MVRGNLICNIPYYYCCKSGASISNHPPGKVPRQLVMVLSGNNAYLCHDINQLQSVPIVGWEMHGKVKLMGTAPL